MVDANVQPIVRPPKKVELTDEEKIDSMMEEKPAKRSKKKEAQAEEVSDDDSKSNMETPEEA